ncbi:rubredoxin, partial [Aetokthonos hydrillicola]
MQEYLCGICGHVYNPEDGDPEGGVEPGTAFENIPE